jgi:hypothetical protein
VLIGAIGLVAAFDRREDAREAAAEPSEPYHQVVADGFAGLRKNRAWRVTSTSR